MFCFLQVFCILFSGTLLAFGIPNELYLLGCPVFGLFALIPLYIAIYRSKSYKQAFWLNFLHGSWTHLLSSFWLGNFHGFAAFTLGGSLIGTALIQGFTGLVMYFPFSKNHQNTEKPSWYTTLNIFWFPSSWIFYEWCKSTGFLGYPWGTVSMTAYRWPLIMQIADITGPYGVSFIFALVSALTAHGIILLKNQNDLFIKEKSFSYILTAKAVFAFTALTLIYGTYQYTKDRPVTKTINTVMVQQNLDTFGSNETEALEISQMLTDEGVKELKSRELNPDLIVWSEGVLAKRYPNAHKYYQHFPETSPLIPYIKGKKLPFIIGGSYTLNAEKHQASNVAILFDKKGLFKGVYSKLHLVPFAEAIPFVEYEWIRNIIKKIAGFSYGWTAGKKNTLFEIPINSEQFTDYSGTEVISLTGTVNNNTRPAVKVSAPICFDDAFGHVCRGLFNAGSELFMNITNDSWSKTKSAEYQHFVVASYRAIECRTTLARCTNSGFTCVISPTGKILDSINLFDQNYLAMPIPVYQHIPTFVTVWGDLFALLVILFLALFIIWYSKQEQEKQVKEISTELIKPKRRARSTKIKSE